MGRGKGEAEYCDIPDFSAVLPARQALEYRPREDSPQNDGRDRYGIKERGYLREGYKADISIVDPAKLSVDESRPDAAPGGIHSVYINGKAVLKNGEYLGGTNGEFILKK